MSTILVFSEVTLKALHPKSDHKATHQGYFYIPDDPGVGWRAVNTLSATRVHQQLGQPSDPGPAESSRRPSSVLEIHGLSVCLSVRLSVCLSVSVEDSDDSPALPFSDRQATREELRPVVSIPSTTPLTSIIQQRLIPRATASHTQNSYTPRRSLRCGGNRGHAQTTEPPKVGNRNKPNEETHKYTTLVLYFHTAQVTSRDIHMVNDSLFIRP